ncbi:MAG: hypothetical protein ACE3L7_30150 [Candidatus Pristimantibacillus sp.]
MQDQAILDIVSGKEELSALLPVQIPASMKSVEEQFEDVPHDLEVHIIYDFGFGMNWTGVI